MTVFFEVFTACSLFVIAFALILILINFRGGGPNVSV